MSTEEKKALVRRYIEEAVNKGNLAILDEVLSPEYRNPVTPSMVTSIRSPTRSV